MGLWARGSRAKLILIKAGAEEAEEEEQEEDRACASTTVWSKSIAVRVGGRRRRPRHRGAFAYGPFGRWRRFRDTKAAFVGTPGP